MSDSLGTKVNHDWISVGTYMYRLCIANNLDNVY